MLKKHNPNNCFFYSVVSIKHIIYLYLNYIVRFRDVLGLKLDIVLDRFIFKNTEKDIYVKKR